MMCANYAHLADVVQEINQSMIDSFHIDIMDGEFVDNFGMGYQDMEFIRRSTSKEMDIHLMVCKPILYLPILYDLGVDVIYIHPEADRDPASTIEKIKLHGIKAGIAINPGTSLFNVCELLNIVDKVLILGVNPGHAGRKYQDYVDAKLQDLIDRCEGRYEIWLDGAVTVERIKRWKGFGVDGFVLGTSALFKQGKSIGQAMADIKIS